MFGYKTAPAGPGTPANRVRFRVRVRVRVWVRVRVRVRATVGVRVRGTQLWLGPMYVEEWC